VSKMRSLQDVLDADMCSGCGACRYQHPEYVVAMKNDIGRGYVPVLDRSKQIDDAAGLEVCPGNILEPGIPYSSKSPPKAYLVGLYKSIYEGFAIDKEIRHIASSGGILTAMALYCLEEEGMEFVLHTGMDHEKPWQNCTVISRNREELLRNAGSRYNSSSPCSGLKFIEEAAGKCVFIGKPCDVSAVQKARKLNPKLDRNLGVVLTFFCAGTPSTQATLALLNELDAPVSGISMLNYRGEGWPGGFHARYDDSAMDTFLSYEESWSKLNRQRPIRCFVCPDGLGEFADISSGDAWHRYKEESDGLSIILPRTNLGSELMSKAVDAGYISIEESTIEDLLRAQPLIKRRQEIWGKIAGMRTVGLRVPAFRGFHLLRAWLSSSFLEKIKSLLYWRRHVLKKAKK
jgi:coenzyme F420 hydrogenase subunit beta